MTETLLSWADDECRAAAVFHGIAVRHELAGNVERARALREVAAACMWRAMRWQAAAALQAGRTAVVP